MNARALIWFALAAILGLLTLVVVVVMPAIDNPCEGATVLTGSTLPTFGGPAPGDARAAANASGPPNPSGSSTVSTVVATPSLAAGAGPIRRTLPLEAGKFVVSDVFGARGGTHLGVDLAAPDGTTIYSVADGKVVAAGPASGFGNWVVVDSVDVNGRAYSAVYGHMWDSGVHVRVGDTVTAGQPIAQVGSAGQSTGPHLHFEIVPGGRFTGGHQIDPVPWLDGAPTPDVGGAKAFSADPRCSLGFGTAGGALAAGKVPPELEIWYRRAGSLCAEITPSLLAAQGRQESGFARGQTSEAGAQGLAQFVPGTANSINPEDGRPYVIDTGNKGYASAWDDGDAIIGQGRYMCALAHRIERWMAEGRVQGDVVSLTLAAYNAGEGAVLASGGMPNQYPAHFSQTRPYVANILAMEPQYRAQGSSGRFQPQEGGGSGQIVQAARQWLGTPYVWGGGDPQGPSSGGLDGPGLTSAAVFAASSGAVSLPRTAEQQWEAGGEVPRAKAQPGDLVFAAFGPRGPSLVGIYSGTGTMIVSAPNTGGVTEIPVPGDARMRRVL
ncbi:peptidase [Nocardia panacis]|uniref:Peptidase n=1 Tax=Nocardia panacis TaxID=2340916 RepID=A0A3A4K6R5_9NOCA|nr:peptidoglycan DD-metalloendopeptidase family protein [Nocardia panacis]RJO68379.1 peptidase [Nocardia panacis]